jgi:glycosyltransferase involved in cell wall biosynthesis
MDHAAGLNLSLSGRALRANDCLTFASTAARAKYLRAYPEGVRSAVLPYFVPGLRGGRPAPATPDRTGLAAVYRLDPARKWVLYFGRFGPEKNTAALLSLWSRMARTDATLILVGADSTSRTFGFDGLLETEEWEELVCARRQQRHAGVRWLAPLTRRALAPLVAAADVVVNPTLCLEEDFGLSAAEALAAGTPVVCSDWGGLRDIVLHGGTGFRARTFLNGGRARLDEAEFSSYLERLLEDESLRRELSENCRIRAISEYSEIVFVDRLRTLVASVADSDESLGSTTMTPAEWIRPAYERALANRSASRIYQAEGLFNALYTDYATPVTSTDRQTAGASGGVSARMQEVRACGDSQENCVPHRS